MSRLSAREISLSPSQWHLRMTQSPLSFVPNGQWGALQPMADQAKSYSADPSHLDRFDQEVASALVQSLQHPETPIPPAIQILKDGLRFPDAVKPGEEEERLIRALNEKIDHAIRGLDGVDAATKAKLEAEIKKSAATHCRVLQLERDDGSRQFHLGYREQHGRWRGGRQWTGGGLRWAPYVSPDEVAILSRGMTWKNALADLGFSGAKGGIACNPKEMSDGEMRRMARSFGIAFAIPVAAYRDKPAGDIGTTWDQLILWHQEALGEVVGERTAPGSYTGKPFIPGRPMYINGSKKRGDGTGLGGVDADKVVRRLAAGIGISIGDNYIVQGAGNAGAVFASLMGHAGANVLGVCNSSMAWFDPKGLSLDILDGLKAVSEKKLKLGDIAKPNMTPQQLLMQRTDVLVPAAAHWTISSEVIANFQGQMILSLANHPYQPAAEALVRERALRGELLDLDDIHASGGGVTFSEAESNQNLDGVEWTEDQELAWGRDHMTRTTEAIFEYWRPRRGRISFGQAAWELGASILARTMTEAGM